jgi:hypothetical protein
MAVFIGSIGSSVKSISEKDYNKLVSIQNAAQKYAYGLKGSISKSAKLNQYRNKWESLAESLGIFDGREVRYVVKNTNKDYSHGYSFGDTLA